LSSWKDKKYHEIVKNQAYTLAAESSAEVFDGIGNWKKNQ